MNSQHSLSTSPVNKAKDLEANGEICKQTTTVQTNTTSNPVSDTPRRNKRRKPPSYYQSAEYAAILKNNGSSDTSSEVNGLSNQISSMGLNEKSDDEKKIITNGTNGEASAKAVEAPRMVWGKPVGPVAVVSDTKETNGCNSQRYLIHKTF